MTYLYPDLPKSARLNLSQVARVLEIDRCTVRSNSKKFHIHPRMNVKTKRTIYTGEQVNMLWRAML